MTTIKLLQFYTIEYASLIKRLAYLSDSLKYLLKRLEGCLIVDLGKLIIVSLLIVLGTSTALAMSPPPAEPSPDPIIPQIDPKPETPELFLDLSQTEIKLRWYDTKHADHYYTFAYADGNWREIEKVTGTTATYDYEQRGWDMDELQFKILACKAKDWYVAMWAWEWGDDKRCSDYSNSVRLPLFGATFSLLSYPMNLSASSSLSSSASSQVPFSEQHKSLPIEDSFNPVGEVRSIVATLRLKDSVSKEEQDFDWPIYLNTETFEVTSNKTIAILAGTYDVEFLAIDGTVTYVAEAQNVMLSETQQNIPLVLRTVLGDSHVTIDTVISLPEFQFQYDPEELTGFTQPKIGVVIDGGNEVLLTLNPQTGITDQYLSISEGQHNIKLRFYDGVLLKGRSKSSQEDPIIVAGQAFAMDLIPLYGETTLSLNTAESEATFNFAIPTVAIEEVGGNPDDLQVILSLSGLNNQPEDVALPNLTYNATLDVYEAQYTYTGMQADTQMTLSLTFTDLSAGSDQLLGTCVVGSFLLYGESSTTPCQLTLRRRAIVDGNLLAVLGINMFDATHTPIRGVRIYAKRQDSSIAGDEDDLGTLLGLTGSGTFSAPGYLKTYLVSGNYQLTAKYVPIDGTAQETISLNALEVTNQDLFLDKSLDQNHLPSIIITPPAEGAKADKSYSIQWIASDADDDASISLYYDTNNSDYDGELITHNLVEGTDTSYPWNTSAVPEGDYYIYAAISDGVYEVKAYSAQPLTIDHYHGSAHFNAPNSNYAHNSVMALLNPTDGRIHAWGGCGGCFDYGGTYGGTRAPTDGGYTKIYSSYYNSFAALKADGSITTWGKIKNIGADVLTVNGYTEITSNIGTFVALKADGSINAWDVSSSSPWTGINFGFRDAPTDAGYTKIYSTLYAFAALKADGSITAWGESNYGGGTREPTDTGYTKIYSNAYAFAALKADGSITAWGHSYYGGTGAPTDTGYTKIYSTRRAFAALKADGSITAWGHADGGGTGAPADSGYTKIYSNAGAFAALKADGSITAWGDRYYGGTGAPTDDGYTKIYSNHIAFVAIKADGSITAWGSSHHGIGAPTDSGYTKIYSTGIAFAALKADGSITAWGRSDDGGTGAPTDTGYISIYSTSKAFTAVKADGTVFSWGHSDYGGSGAPANLNDTPSHNQNQNYQLKLNDTGITWGSDYPSGINSTCTGETITQQDCSHGRDARAAAGTLTKVGGGVGGFDFTRLNADGSDYTGNGDYNSQPWACVKDNHTGLIWEVKTDDGGIHYKDRKSDWAWRYFLVNLTNDEFLCGFDDWRIPTLMELMSIVNKGIYPPIDSSYFPNAPYTQGGWPWIWTSSGFALDTSIGWVVNSHGRSLLIDRRSSWGRMRLVRSAQ